MYRALRNEFFNLDPEHNFHLAGGFNAKEKIYVESLFFIEKVSLTRISMYNGNSDRSQANGVVHVGDGISASCFFPPNLC